MDTTKLKADDWKNFFSGRWSILSASYWGEIYTQRPFSKLVDMFVSDSILIHQNEKGLSGYFRASEITDFGNNLAASIRGDTRAIEYICGSLIKKANAFLELVDKNIGKDISAAEYESFQETLADYYCYHIQNKYAPEGMSEAMLRRYLDDFEKARVHAEPVFMRSEEFMNELAALHAERTGWEPRMILSVTKDEFSDYLSSGTLPDRALVEERQQATALVTREGDTQIYSGKDFEEIMSIIEHEGGDTIVGNTAYAGRVKGRVKIIFDPKKAADFKEGDILVTKMTRPDYLPLMKLAAAFVTDGGGILSHAAIVARELKKSCVIGTQIATKVLKDGDTVEVDAERGIVTVLSRS